MLANWNQGTLAVSKTYAVPILELASSRVNQVIKCSRNVESMYGALCSVASFHCSHTTCITKGPHDVWKSDSKIH